MTNVHSFRSGVLLSTKYRYVGWRSRESGSWTQDQLGMLQSVQTLRCMHREWKLCIHFQIPFFAFRFAFIINAQPLIEQCYEEFLMSISNYGLRLGKPPIQWKSYFAQRSMVIRHLIFRHLQCQNGVDAIWKAINAKTQAKTTMQCPEEWSASKRSWQVWPII